MKYHWNIIQISFLYIYYIHYAVYIFIIYHLYIHLILILICVWTFERDLYWSTCLDAFPWWDTIWLWRDLPRPWRQLMWPRGSRKFKFNGWSCWQFRRVQIVLVNDMFFIMIQRSFCYFFLRKNNIFSLRLHLERICNCFRWLKRVLAIVVSCCRKVTSTSASASSKSLKLQLAF